jgi:arylsulfatase A-like enzyme
MKNVLLITIDCLRADRLNPDAHPRRLAPHIEQLAADSIRFRQAYATGPRTAESFPAILASTYPMTFEGNWKLPEEVRTLARHLQQSGFNTAAFHSNPFLSANLGYARGFDHFWDSREVTPLTSRMGDRLMRWVSPDSRLRRLLRRAARYFETRANLAHYAPADTVTGEAMNWLAHRPTPFFAWLHYMDLHYPYAPPERHLHSILPGGINKRLQADLLVRSLEDPGSVSQTEAQLLRALYNAGLLYIDESVGQLLASLSEMDLQDDTIVILTADHGEEFLEHGRFGHGGDIHVLQEDRAQIRLFDELLHVPLLVRPANESEWSRDVDTLVSLIDLPPTIVDLLGLKPAGQWQGRSLKALARGPADPVREGVFSEYAIRAEAARYPVVSYRTSSWKFIYDGAFGRHHLYDLAADPTEQHNSYAADRPPAPELAQIVEEHLAEVCRFRTRDAEPELDPKTVERLRSLGYIE